MIRIEDIVTNKGERTFSESFYEYGIDMTRNDILPGHYYMLEVPVPNFNEAWIPRSKEDWEENPELYITRNEYYDMSPVGLVLYHDRWKENALILNLKVIPPKYRTKVIMTHLNLIEKSLDRLNVFDKDEELVPLVERRRMNLPLYGVTPSMLSELSNFKLNYAINGYKLDKITRAKLLDWDRIGELPLANVDTRGLAISSSLFDAGDVFDIFENKQLI